MSLEAFSWALNTTVGDGRRKLILMGLANHAHKDGTSAFPSRETLAEYAECDPKTVSRALKALAHDGFIRLGDERLVEHLRADRRPRVYDLAMTETRRELWRAVETPAEVITARVDNLSPRPAEHGGTPCPPAPEATGGHLATSRVDTAVSTEPSLNQLPPQPPSELGGACPKHSTTAARPNCRGCGTTPRQLETRRQRDATERRRLADAAAAAAARARAERSRVDAAAVAPLLAATREQLAAARDSQ